MMMMMVILIQKIAMKICSLFRTSRLYHLIIILFVPLQSPTIIMPLATTTLQKLAFQANAAEAETQLIRSIDDSKGTKRSIVLLINRLLFLHNYVRLVRLRHNVLEKSDKRTLPSSNSVHIEYAFVY